MATATAERLHLWEIADEIQALGEKLHDAGGELTPELEAEWDHLEGSLESKVEGTALYIRELQANAAAAKQEEDRLKRIRTALESKAGRLKDYMHYQLKRAGKDRVETPRAKVWVQPNSRPSIRFMGPEIPEAYRKVSVSLDGTAAYESWRSGEPLPDGFVVETGDHLRIG